MWRGQAKTKNVLDQSSEELSNISEGFGSCSAVTVDAGTNEGASSVLKRRKRSRRLGCCTIRASTAESPTVYGV